MHCGEYFTTDFARITESFESVRAFPILQSAFADEYVFERLQEYYLRKFSNNTVVVKAFLGILKDCRASRRGQILRATQLYGVPLLCLERDEPGMAHDMPCEASVSRFTFVTGLA